MTEIINTFVFPIIRRDWILDALASLRANTPENYHVIVIDQTVPDPDTRFENWLREGCDLWVKPRKNYGFAQAANMGIRLAPTPYVTVCNDDVEFPWDGWWQGIEETYARYDNLAAVNPTSPKEPGWGWGKKGFIYYCINCGARYIDEERPCKCDNYEPLGLEDMRNNASKMQLMIDAANGAMIDGIACWCPVFRREALDEIGLFDERFNPGGGEDYDWSARCYQAGYRGIATSLSWVWHHWGQSKDAPDGFDTALPLARPRWNYLSTKGDPVRGLWEPDVDVWGHNCTRTDENVYRAPL